MEQIVIIKSGEAVKISAPNTFKGFKLGIYMGVCKKDGGKRVYLTDYDFPIREVCIHEDKGDTILPLKKRE